MRKLLLFALAAVPFLCQAQTLTFETLPLSGNDTFYVNTLNPGTDKGFNAGSVHFPYYYDSSIHNWSAGFIYSSKTDTVTSGYTNMYSAKAGHGNNNSGKYLVWTAGYGTTPNLYIPQNPNDTVENTNWFAAQSIYVTNGTYAYNSMKNGDMFAKKFGGATGNDADWFKLTIKGYKHHGHTVNAGGTVEFYLADFRSSNNAQDYIIKDWTRVDLLPLGGADSLGFSLSSSDTAGGFGMNTPGYFCMDDFTFTQPTAVSNVPAQSLAKVYPNPAIDQLFIDINDAAIKQASVYDVTGKLVATQPVNGSKLTFNTATFAHGIYVLKLEGLTGSATVRFVKQ